MAVQRAKYSLCFVHQRCELSEFLRFWKSTMAENNLLQWKNVGSTHTQKIPSSSNAPKHWRWNHALRTSASRRAHNACAFRMYHRLSTSLENVLVLSVLFGHTPPRYAFFKCDWTCISQRFTSKMRFYDVSTLITRWVWKHFINTKLCETTGCTASLNFSPNTRSLNT